MQEGQAIPALSDTRSVCGVPITIQTASAALVPYLSAEIGRYERDAHEFPLLCAIHSRPGGFTGSANPSIHLEQSDGFVAKYPAADIRYQFHNRRLKRVSVHLNRNSGRLERLFRRWVSIQYTDPEQSIGQVFHELAAIPAALLSGSVAPIHAGAFLSSHGTVMLGGTGGVGKTTLTVRACLDGNGKFVADDIAVIGADGVVHPNLAFPKVYAYNVEADPIIANLTMNGRGPLDRVQWWARRRLGAAAVRRRVDPERLFGGVASASSRAVVYAFLSQHQGASSPMIRPTTPEIAARASVEIMRSEYEVFLKHLAWHEAYCVTHGIEPMVSVESVLQEWESVLVRGLATARCVIVDLPGSLDLSSQRSLIQQLIGLGETA